MVKIKKELELLENMEKRRSARISKKEPVSCNIEKVKIKAEPIDDAKPKRTLIKSEKKEDIIDESETKASMDTSLTQKRKPKGKSIKKSPKTKKKKRNIPSLDKKMLQSGVKAVLQMNQSNTDNKLFDDEIPIYLQILPVKIPKMPKQKLSFTLAHSLHTPDSEICLITSEMKHKRDRWFDENIEANLELLNKKGITNIKEVIPYRKFLAEYSDYETLRRFIQLYDLFLIDSKVFSNVWSKFKRLKVGQRKDMYPIHMDRIDLKGCIAKKMKKTSFYVHALGNNYSVKVGHSKMEMEKIVENIRAAAQGIDRVFPGRFNNISSLNLKTSLGFSVPIYVALKPKSDVMKLRPRSVQTKNAQYQGTITDELNISRVVKVRVAADGNVKTYTKNMAKYGNLKKKQEKKLQKEKVTLLWGEMVKELQKGVPGVKKLESANEANYFWRNLAKSKKQALWRDLQARLTKEALANKPAVEKFKKTVNLKKSIRFNKIVMKNKLHKKPKAKKPKKAKQTKQGADTKPVEAKTEAKPKKVVKPKKKRIVLPKTKPGTILLNNQLKRTLQLTREISKKKAKPTKE